ncbi:MAG: hypothetical protein WAM65_03645, partial [Candidatus Korobacteraceae bacterium]
MDIAFRYLSLGLRSSRLALRLSLFARGFWGPLTKWGFEGDGLQAVRTCPNINAALQFAEKRITRQFARFHEPRINSLRAEIRVRTDRNYCLGSFFSK